VQAVPAKFNFSHMNNETITITLTIPEADLCLGALSEKPFKDVHMLMNKILEQGRAQQQPPAPPVEKLQAEPV
jgi:hypothetical protein